jgi:hypothetical protein
MAGGLVVGCHVADGLENWVSARGLEFVRCGFLDRMNRMDRMGFGILFILFILSKKRRLKNRGVVAFKAG